MKLKVNGEEREVPDAWSVRQLVADLSLDKPGVAVEVNRKIVPRRTYDQTSLKEGDQVEIVSLVGGG